MLKLNIEEKLMTTVDKLYAFRTVKWEPIIIEYTDEITDKQTLPTDCSSFKSFDEPFTLFDQIKYYWFKAKFEVDELLPQQKAYLCIETFIGGVASTIRPQGLLYLNGELVQGIDINHTD